MDFAAAEAQRQVDSRNSLRDSSMVMVGKDQVFSKLGDEVVILDLKSGKYFGLNTVAATVWSMMKTPRRVEEIWTSLLDQYEVDAVVCRAEVLGLLNDLACSGLIEVVEGSDHVSSNGPI